MTAEKTGQRPQVSPAHVVVGYLHGPTGDAAIAAAAHEAQMRDTRLLVVHQLVGDEVPDRYGPDAGRVAPRTEEMDAMRRIAHAAEPGLDRVEVKIVSGPITKTLVSESWSAALLVLGVTTSHARTAVLFDTVPHAVIGKAHCPVMLVGAGPTPGEHLLCGVDRGEVCLAALTWAAREAARRGSTLQVLEVLAAKDRRDPKVAEADLSQWVDEVLRASDATVRCAARHGSPAKELIAMAAEQDAVLVIGAQRRTGRYRVRSVTQTVTAQHDVAVVVVPETDATA